MKKAFVILCVIATLIIISGCSKEYTYGVYEIELSTELISNDHVGNDWKVSYSCNGTKINGGEQWLALLDNPQPVVIDITVKENDKIPDIGTGSLTVTFNGESEIKTEISVTEDGGSHQGNKARWEVTCKVNLIEMK